MVVNDHMCAGNRISVLCKSHPSRTRIFHFKITHVCISDKFPLTNIGKAINQNMQTNEAKKFCLNVCSLFVTVTAALLVHQPEYKNLKGLFKVKHERDGGRQTAYIVTECVSQTYYTSEELLILKNLHHQVFWNKLRV